MQKKLLSLIVATTMTIAYTISCAQETVPVISPAEHAENEKQCKKLIEDINASEEEINKKKKKKDELENKLHSHRQRIQYREQFVAELSGEKEAIKKYKILSDAQVDKNDSDMKKHDNGITVAGMFGSLNDPLPDSRSGKAYERIKATTNAQKLINQKLAEEHLHYMSAVEKNVLPPLAFVLNRKNTTMDNLIASFRQCDCYEGADYDKCLDDEGITTRQRSTDFPRKFVDRGYAAAYEAAQKEGTPIRDKEEMMKIAALNEITKPSAAKAEEKQEELRKVIARERNTPEGNSTLEIPENK